MHALSIGIIEIADDGQSGRSFYLTPGTMFDIIGRGDKRSGGWLWERYGSDFVYKNGQWLYVHEHVCPDFGSNYDGTNWGHDTWLKALNPEPERGPHGPDGGVTEYDHMHKDYTICQLVQDTCPPPVPYKTLDDENSYAAGHNNFD